jgi:hypothetical protein
MYLTAMGRLLQLDIVSQLLFTGTNGQSLFSWPSRKGKKSKRTVMLEL